MEFFFFGYEMKGEKTLVKVRIFIMEEGLKDSLRVSVGSPFRRVSRLIAPWNAFKNPFVAVVMSRLVNYGVGPISRLV